jgi:hypothetical protein
VCAGIVHWRRCLEGIPGSDRVVFDRLARLLPGAAFVPFSEIWNRGLPARAGQFWISTRFHFHLLAAAIGASGLVLPGRTDYYPIKHQSLVELGSNWGLADANGLPPVPVHNGGFDPDTVTTLRERKTALAEAIYPRRPAYAIRQTAKALSALKLLNR